MSGFFNFGTLLAGLLVLEWTVRIVMLFIIPRKQRISTVNAWLLLIMIFPIFGTIVYYMFGNPNLPRSRRETLKAVKKLTHKELSGLESSQKSLFATINNDAHQSIATLATKLGGLPPMHGNDVYFYSDYDGTFQVIADAIDTAQDYVHIQYFIAALDGSTAPVFDAIERAAERGVTVRFMYDKVLSKHFKGGRALQKWLKTVDIQVVEMLPLSLIPGRTFTRPDLRNHRKLVIVDGDTAFTGSQNLIQKSYGRRDSLVYEELVAQLSGPAVWQLNNVFRSDWYAEISELLLDIVEDRDVPPKQGSAITQVLPSGPNQDHDNNLKLYTTMVHNAKKSVSIVVPYFIPDESLFDALITAAQRGVNVTIINSEIIDKTLAGHAQRSYYEALLKVGVHIHLYKPPVFLHAKQVTIDDEVVVFGSSNLDMRSFELNFELSVIVYDHTVAAKVKSVEEEYIAKSHTLTIEGWAARSLRDKLLDQFSRLAAAFL